MMHRRSRDDTRMSSSSSTSTSSHNQSFYAANAQDVIDKRLASLEYLRKVHGGTICWLNTVHMSKRDFDSLYNDENRHPPLNSLHYFYLGGSIPSIFEQPNLPLYDYLKTFLNLLKEYETLTGAENTPRNRIAGVGRRLFRNRLKSDAAHTDLSMVTSGGATTNGQGHGHGHGNGNSSGSGSGSGSGNGKPPRPASFSGMNGLTLKPMSSSLPSSTRSTTTLKHSHDFVHLNIYHLPFVPDTYETFLSLCEALIEAYKRIKTSYLQATSLPSSAVSHECYELLLKLDDKLKKHVIGPTVKDIDTLSKSLIYDETSKLDGLLIQAK